MATAAFFTISAGLCGASSNLQDESPESQQRIACVHGLQSPSGVLLYRGTIYDPTAHCFTRPCLWLPNTLGSIFAPPPDSVVPRPAWPTRRIPRVLAAYCLPPQITKPQRRTDRPSGLPSSSGVLLCRGMDLSIPTVPCRFSPGHYLPRGTTMPGPIEGSTGVLLLCSTGAIGPVLLLSTIVPSHAVLVTEVQQYGGIAT